MSKLPFELMLALRYLRPKRTFVSIITLISIVGVALGVAVLIIVISVMSGFDHELREKILGFNAHLTVTQVDPATGASTTMKNYRAVSEIVSKNKNVRGVSPFIMGPVLVETEGDTNHPSLQDAPVLRGVNPETESNVSKLPDEVMSGKFELSGHGMVVGADFAANLHLEVGDHLSVLSESAIKKMREAYKHKEEVTVSPDDYEVRGIFSSGYYDYDAHVVITSLDNAQDLYDLDDAVHGLFVMLNDPYQAAAAQAQLEQSLGDQYSVTTWMQQNSIILNQLVVEKSMMFYIMFFIVIVAAFGITCTLITFVILKTREIGVMKAIGASNFQVMLIFLIQSLVVSILGIMFGLVFGLYAIHIRNGFLHFMNRLTGWNLFPPSLYGFYNLPALVSPTDVMIICGGSLIICIAAAILPSRFASKLKPVEALRYE